MEDDDSQSTCVEPVISYCSPLNIRGVKEISNTKFNSYRSNYNAFSDHPASVNNTIMLPFIASDGSIQTEKSNKNMNNSKENSSNNYYMKFDSTRNKTIGSKSDNEQKNNESMNLKITQTYNDHSPNILKKSSIIFKRFSLGLPETNYEILNLRSSQFENNYESDNIANYNKKNDENKESHNNTKDSIRTTKTRRIHINEEKIPSLFLKTEKQDKKNNKNFLVFKSKKRRKTQKVQNKENKMNLKKKDKAVLFFIEKSKSFSNEEIHRNCQSSHKKDKSNGNIGDGKMAKNVYRSNKNVKNIKESINKEDQIKKNWTSKAALVEKYKSVGKTEKKKKRKNDRKISFKDNNFNNKLVKLMFSRNTEVKNNKYESSGLKMLRDHINNRNYKEKKEDDKYKKEKSKKVGKRSLNSKEKTEKEKNRLSEDLKSGDRRQSGFLSKDEVIKKIFDNKASYREKRASKKERLKHESNINNESKKELKMKDSNNESNNNILLKISRRKRSISLHYRNNKMQEISEALRAKLPKKIPNLNLNVSSTSVIKKAKKKEKTFRCRSFSQEKFKR